MTRQAAEPAAALERRMQLVFDDTPRTQHVEAGGVPHPNWRRPPADANGTFGDEIPDVMAVIVHFTTGWPSREKWSEFFDRYNTVHHAKWGIGPHYYLSGDGHVYRVLSDTLKCHHAGYVSEVSIGVETGNLNHVSAPTAGGVFPNHWAALSAATHDVPDAKFYAISKNHEITVALWTTTSAGVPVNSNPDHNVMMLPTERQYRSWALLARWLAEVWRVPRNFPLRPYLRRQDTWGAGNWQAYRQLVDADPMRDPHIRDQLQITDAQFRSNNPATGLPHLYAAAVQAHPSRNRYWTALFQSFRGFHSHAFSGDNGGHDHNCPGAWFEWQRFARDVWDYWWYPVDLAQATPTAAPTSGRPRRDYGRTDDVLKEYYFDEEPSSYAKVTTAGFFPIGEETVAEHPPTHVQGVAKVPALGMLGELVRMGQSYWGFWHGGMHFNLDQGSPIYAMAAGQIVAARLHEPTVNPDGFDRYNPATIFPSALFVLVRHEVFWRHRAGGPRIDYDQEPTRVYTLYMHLGLPNGLSFVDIVDANPTWLNRVLLMKKEYDLGLAFQAGHPNPAGQWAEHLTRWARQRQTYDRLLADLQAGRVALFPEGEDAIRVGVGDYVGVAGHLHRNTFGMHAEVFSRDQIQDAWFEAVDQSAAASRPYQDEANLEDVTAFIKAHIKTPAGHPGSTYIYRELPKEQKATRFQNIALRLKSEWALRNTDFPDGGWAPAQRLMWWSDVVPGMNGALNLDTAARLPEDGVVWHYHPLGFMAWLNGRTWRSEWPKYRVVDAAGAPVPVPPRPPQRR